MQKLAQKLVWAADVLVVSIWVVETRNKCSSNVCTSLKEQVSVSCGNMA